MLKILKIESLQDGVIRFEFVAGESAVEAVEQMEDIIRRSSEILRVEPSALPKTVEKFFEEWKEQKKEIERLKEDIARIKAEILLENSEEFNSIKVVADVVDADMQELLKLGTVLAEKGAVGCLMSKKGGKVLVVTFSGKEYDARELIREIGRSAKGNGGGRKELAQGAVQKLLSREEIMDIIFRYLTAHEVQDNGENQ